MNTTLCGTVAVPCGAVDNVLYTSSLGSVEHGHVEIIEVRRINIVGNSLYAQYLYSIQRRDVENTYVVI